LTHLAHLGLLVTCLIAVEDVFGRFGA